MQHGENLIVMLLLITYFTFVWIYVCLEIVNILQIKYYFGAYQKSEEKIKNIRLAINDPYWRPPPLQIVNVSL